MVAGELRLVVKFLDKDLQVTKVSWSKLVPIEKSDKLESTLGRFWIEPESGTSPDVTRFVGMIPIDQEFYLSCPRAYQEFSNLTGRVGIFNPALIAQSEKD